MQILYFDKNGRLESYNLAGEGLLVWEPDDLEISVWLDDSRSPNAVIHIEDEKEFKACCRDFGSSIHSDGFNFTPYQPLDELDPDDKHGFHQTWADDPPF